MKKNMTIPISIWHCFIFLRRTEKAILVPQTRVISTPSTFGTVNSANNLPNGHSPFSETRRMSATRDIYLPSNVPMTALNKAYIPENEEPEVLPSKYETDTIEASNFVSWLLVSPYSTYIFCHTQIPV